MHHCKVDFFNYPQLSDLTVFEIAVFSAKKEEKRQNIYSNLFKFQSPEVANFFE